MLWPVSKEIKHAEILLALPMTLVCIILHIEAETKLAVILQTKISNAFSWLRM